jgi:general secretion pathway protein D
VIDIVENLAGQCKFSVKVKDELTSQMMKKQLSLVHIEDYLLDDMFNFLFTQNNMFYSYDKNRDILRVLYTETKSFVIDYINLTNHNTSSSKNILVGSLSSENASESSSEDGQNNSDKTIVNSETNFNFWGNIKDEIKSITSLNNENISVNVETGVVTITGNADQMNLVETYINKLTDRLHKQVMLEVKLFEVQYSDSSSIGIDWEQFFKASVSLGKSRILNNNGYGFESDRFSDGVETLSGTKSFNLGFAETYVDFKMGDLINFLDSYGDVNVISTPKIMTLNNQPAVINVGDQYNYQYVSNRSIDNEGRETYSTTNGSSFIGLTLNILPEITDNENIILRVNPVVSDIISMYDDRAPDIKIKQSSSIIKAKNGTRVISGGLVSYSTDKKDNKIPLLGDIPLIGYAFKNSSSEIVKKELIIIVTPTIIDHNNYPTIENMEELMSNFRDE